MKKSELISIIKLAVREELKTTLPELLSEIKTQNKTTSMSVEKTEAKIKKTKQSDSGKLYSRNEKLNEALRATVGGIPQEGQLVSSTDTSTQTTSVTSTPSTTVTSSPTTTKISSSIQSQNQMGSGTVAGIVVATLILVLGIIGYLIWNHRKENSKPTE